MRIRLPTALLAYGLEGPSASSTVNNLNSQGIHLRNPKTCPNKPSHFSWHASPAYQALISLRRQAADVVLLAYEE
jgi:hypothetical protein